MRSCCAFARRACDTVQTASSLSDILNSREKLRPSGVVLIAVIEVLTVGDNIGRRFCRAAESECKLKRLLTLTAPFRTLVRITFDQRGDQRDGIRNCLVLARTYLRPFGFHPGDGDSVLSSRCHKRPDDDS